MGTRIDHQYRSALFTYTSLELSLHDLMLFCAWKPFTIMFDFSVGFYVLHELIGIV